MAGNVVEWALRIKQSGASEAAKAVAQIGNAAGDAAADVARLGKETEDAAAAALKAAGAYRDAAGRLRDARGRFLKNGGADLLSGLGVKLPKTPTFAPTDGASLSDQFDALQRTLPTSQNANAILFGQSVARGLANLKALRAAAKASAAPTDAEKMLGGALTDQLRPAQDLNVIQRGVRRFLQSVASAGGGRTIRALGAIYDGFEKAQPAIDAAREAAARAAPIMSALGTATLAAGAATVALAGGAALLATKFAVSVVQAQAYRENIEGALNTLLRSQQAGKDALAVAVQTADMIGKSRSAVAGQFVDLLAKGFDVRKVDTIVRSLADLSTVDPRADLDRLTLAIGQIAATGRLQGDELNQLANSGLEASSVYDALAKRLGKTRAEVIKLKEAGKISSDLAIDAIIDAINMQSGGRAAGAAAAEKSMQSLSGLFGRLQAAPENLLFSIGVKSDLGILKSSLAELVTFFDLGTAQGERLATVTEKVFGALIQGFLGTDAKKGADGIRDSMNSLLDGIEESVPEIRKFAENVRKLVDVGVDIVDFVGDVLAAKDSVKQFLDGLGPVGTVIQLAFFPLFFGAEAIFFLIDGLRTLGSALSGVASSAYEIGSQIINGLVAGIQAGLSAVVDAISGVASGAITTAKSILGIKSPSKVFEEIGMYTAMGFERGIVMNDNGAAADLVAPPDVSGVFAGGAAVGAGIAAGGTIVNVGGINVDARGATAADAQRIAEAIDERLVRTLENIALGVGAAA